MSALVLRCHRDIKLSGSRKCLKEFPHTSLSEQRDVHALSHRALGWWPGCSELPQKTSEEASSSGAKSDLCGGQTGTQGRARVLAHTEAEQRFCLCWSHGFLRSKKLIMKMIFFCTGLLAGLWEFPCVPQEDKNGNIKEKKVLCSEINRILGTSLTHSLLQYVGEVILTSLSWTHCHAHELMIHHCHLQVVHIFSHIHQTYIVHTLCLNDAGSRSENMQWLTRSALQDAAVSTGVKKVSILSVRVSAHG